MAARPPKPPEVTTTNSEEESSSLIAGINQHNYNCPDSSSSTHNLTSNNCSYSDQQKKQLQLLQQELCNSVKKYKNSCLKVIAKNDCPCTNISIMHLFHEMKQKFPTVPDNIVNQCVISNCHDRDNCIRSLQNELNLHSATSQSYPSNALRNQNIANNFQESSVLQSQPINFNTTFETSLPSDHQKLVINNNNYNNNKVLKPTRPAPAPQINIKNLNCDVAKINCNTKHSVQKKPSVPLINYQNQQKLIGFSDKKDVTDNRISTSQSPPQRPTTLKFREPSVNDNRFDYNNAQESTLNKLNNIQLKPVRKAPAPPISILSPSDGNLTPLSSSSSQHATPTSSSQKSFSNQQSLSNFDHSYSSSIQSPFSDSAESEVSVSISLSPTLEHPKILTTNCGSNIGKQHAQPQTPKRITSITLQPEPPYTRDFILQNPSPASQRSYTSLNLTLRKPSSTPQSPIDITAGPGLTYSSSSFDACRGLQKKFHISVNAEGGVFRASSIRPKSFYMPPIPHSEEEFRNIEPANVLRPASSEQNFYNNIIDIPCDNFNKNIILDSPLKEKGYNGVNFQLVERQKIRKEQLIKAIEKNKKKLQQVQDEIHILKTPDIPGKSERLDNDIEILRNNCELLFNEIENSKRLVGQQNTSSGVEYNISRSQLRQRPPRPPPPRLISSQTPNNPIEPIIESSISMSPISLIQSPGSNIANSELQTGNTNFNAATTINNLTDEDGPQWSCKHCTFLNDPLMIRCENCDYDREIPDSMVARHENIHIHLSQGENRVVHSWILS